MKGMPHLICLICKRQWNCSYSQKAFCRIKDYGSDYGELISLNSGFFCCQMGLYIVKFFMTALEVTLSTSKDLELTGQSSDGCEPR